MSDMASDSSEEWRPVPGYEDRYEVSSHGRVRSIGFYAKNRWGGQNWHPPRVFANLVIKPRGYRAVHLSNGDGTRTRHKVHRLMLRAFVGEPPSGKPDGLHEDDDPANNYLDNLRWGNQSENTYDSIGNGLHFQAGKKRCALGHLLVAPNLAASGVKRNQRACLACRRTHSAHDHDAAALTRGHVRTRTYRGGAGFSRILGESFEDEANRRYSHIMRNYDGGAL